MTHTPMILFALGCLLLTVGMALIWLPLAFLAAGAALCFVGWRGLNAGTQEVAVPPMWRKPGEQP